MVKLINIIKTKKAIEILEYLIANQDQEFYQSELTKKVEISKNTLSKWLNNLLKNRILDVRQIGRIKCYRVRKAHPFFKQLKILLTITKIWDVVKELEGKVEVYLYGSVARGEDDQASDVDILILSEIEEKKLLSLVEKVEKNLDRVVRPLVLTPLEYSMLARKDKLLYENIEKSKIRLV